MIGAIIGDVVGSIYEFDNHKDKKFKFIDEDNTFTDDTVLTCAIADFMLDTHGNPSKGRLLWYIHSWCLKYPDMSYGAKFSQWLKFWQGKAHVTWKPYNSFGNGAAMRISPVGMLSYSEQSAMNNAKWVTEASHDHPEAIKGAQAVACLMWKVSEEKDRVKLKSYIEKKFGYDLSASVDELRETYKYNETCQGTVPEAIICFLESKNFEDAIRNAISIGGDSDTLAAITGSIAEAYYTKINLRTLKSVVKKLTPEIKELVRDFYEQVPLRYDGVTNPLLELLDES